MTFIFYFSSSTSGVQYHTLCYDKEYSLVPPSLRPKTCFRNVRIGAEVFGVLG